MPRLRVCEMWVASHLVGVVRERPLRLFLLRPDAQLLMAPP